jgi:hypothetical protein
MWRPCAPPDPNMQIWREQAIGMKKILATSNDAQQEGLDMMRLASINSGVTSRSVAANEMPVRSRLHLGCLGDHRDLEERQRIRRVISHLASAIEGNRAECALWMAHGHIESLGGLTPNHLVDQGLGMLVVEFLLEILAGKRG